MRKGSRAGGTVLIGGSTASGKSALALALAERTGGVVLNADSVQLYRDLPILTARPDPADLARAPHRLYGILEAGEAASVADWLARATAELRALAADGRLAIVTGGTGLYFKALIHGLPTMPDIPLGLRAELRQSTRPTIDLHAELAGLDPALARRLASGDRQRVLRGLEVVLATGRPLTAWQADPPARPQLPEPLAGLALLPPASVVDARIARRLDAMLAAGLLPELEAFLQGPGRRPTALAKADGVAEFGAFLRGEIDLATAKHRTVLKVRRYAKRQRTFFRGQLHDTLPAIAAVADAGHIERLAENLLACLASPADRHAPC
jgi:tRNA dimethylallyltransferase